MATFMMTISFTEQGIRTIRDAPKRIEAARQLAKQLGIEIKQLYLTSGESDMVSFLEASNGDNVAKFALAIGSRGHVRTRTARAWPEAEFTRMVGELPV